jgi:hypothetical protein
MKEYLQVMGIGISILVVLGFMVFAILHTQDERRCRDALLRPDAYGGPIMPCDHDEHTLIRDADRWRCVCPNTRLEEPQQ